jgi:hypothetical protein
MPEPPAATDACLMSTAQTFYVVPRDTDPFVVESLRAQHQSDPSIVVVVDKRDGEERPSAAVLKQRRPVLRRSVDGPVAGARIEQHIPPIALTLAEEPLEAIIRQAAALDPAAAGELRWRSCEFVMMQLTELYGNRDRASAEFPRVMDAILEALPDLKRPEDFHSWLLSLTPRLARDDD